MSQPSPVCPDCKVAMDSGFIVDFIYGTDASEQSSWAKEQRRLVPTHELLIGIIGPVAERTVRRDGVWHGWLSF